MTAGSYKPSRYNIEVEGHEPGRVILFNTLYGSMAVVGPEHRDLVSALLGVQKPIAVDLDCTNPLVERLRRLSFIVAQDVDELEIVRRRRKAGIRDNNRLDVILMPNLNCNFACPYCYESHDRRHRISPAMEARILRWLEKTVPGHKVMLLSWFGGEPLLSAETVIRMTNRTRQLCQADGVRLMTHVTTNGYCLTPKLAHRLLGVGLKRYQITVDGPPETHDQTRPLKSGRGTFEKLHRNIVALARADDEVRIALRVNFNHRNVSQIPLLLELFPRDIRNQLHVVLEPIFGSSDVSAAGNLSAERVADASTRFYARAQSLGYDIRLGSLGVGKLVYCYAEREHQYVIDFKGDVFKCSVSDFASRSRVASIDEEGNLVGLEPNRSRWAEGDRLATVCEQCKYVPLCMGGCRKARLEQGFAGSYCGLIPTNTSYTLKALAFGRLHELLQATASSGFRAPGKDIECFSQEKSSV